VNWTPATMARLERAIEDGARVQLRRGGAVHVLVPRAIRNDYGGELLVGQHLGSGERVEIPLDEVEGFTVVE
jgi:hypothetical protein